MKTTLDRHENEGDAAYVQRLLVDPLCDKATDAELAELSGVKVSIVREQRSRQLALHEALQVAEDIGWDGSVYELIRAALTDYALAACAMQRCSHPGCVTPLLMELAEKGVELRLVDGDRFVSTPKKIDDSLRSWIIERREAIVTELKRAETKRMLSLP